MVGWLVSWFVGGLVGGLRVGLLVGWWLVGWLVGWLAAGWLGGWLGGWLVDWLVCCCLVGGLGWMVGSLVGWLGGGWASGWVVGWLGGWLGAWLVGCLLVGCWIQSGNSLGRVSMSVSQWAQMALDKTHWVVLRVPLRFGAVEVFQSIVGRKMLADLCVVVPSWFIVLPLWVVMR